MARKLSKHWLVLVAVVVVIGSLIYFQHNRAQPALAPARETPAPEATIDSQAAPPFNKSARSLDDPASLWVIVNKQRPLSSSYAPSDLSNASGSMLRTEAATATEELIDAAQDEDVSLKVISGYRSYASQNSVYNSYVRQDGQAAADTYSARPGHSEHQTGWAADLGNSSGLCDLEACFGDTAGGKWLAEHASDFGFVIRYENNKAAVTGYQYEPWHIRYIGKELAAEIRQTGQTLEEFFGLPAAPGY